MAHLPCSVCRCCFCCYHVVCAARAALLLLLCGAREQALQWTIARISSVPLSFGALTVVLAVLLLAHGFLVGFPGASLSVGSPRLTRQSSVPRWFARKGPAVAMSPFDARRRPRQWQRHKGGWYGPPTVFCLPLLLLLLPCCVCCSCCSSSAAVRCERASSAVNHRMHFFRSIVFRCAYCCSCRASACAWLPGWVPWCVAVGRVAPADSAILGAPMVRPQRSCCCDVSFRCSPSSAAMTTPQRWMIWLTYRVLFAAVAVVVTMLCVCCSCCSSSAAVRCERANSAVNHRMHTYCCSCRASRCAYCCSCRASACAWLPGWVPWCVAVGRVAPADSAILGAPMVRPQRSCCCDVSFRCSPPSAAMTTPQRWMIWPTYRVLFAAVAVVVTMLCVRCSCCSSSAAVRCERASSAVNHCMHAYCCSCRASACAWLPGWVPWCVAVGRVATTDSAILGAPMVRPRSSCCCDVCHRCSPQSATARRRPRPWPRHKDSWGPLRLPVAYLRLSRVLAKVVRLALRPFVRPGLLLAYPGFSIWRLPSFGFAHRKLRRLPWRRSVQWHSLRPRTCRLAHSSIGGHSRRNMLLTLQFRFVTIWVPAVQSCPEEIVLGWLATVSRSRAHRKRLQGEHQHALLIVGQHFVSDVCLKASIWGSSAEDWSVSTGAQTRRNKSDSIDGDGLVFAGGHVACFLCHRSAWKWFVSMITHAANFRLLCSTTSH